MEKIGSREWEQDIIFKDAFNIPRDDLLRHLIYLPVRVATTLERRCAQATRHRISMMKTPLISMLESSLAIKQEQFRHSMQVKKVKGFDGNKMTMPVFSDSYHQRKDDVVDVASLEGEVRLVSEQKRQKCELQSRVVCNSSLSGYGSVTGSADVSVADVTLQSADFGNKAIDPSTSVEVGSRDAALSSCLRQLSAVEGVKQREDAGVANGSTTRKRAFTLEEKLVGEVPCKEASPGDSYLTRLHPLAIKEQSDFLISAIRVLRYAKPNQSKEVFDMLSSPNLPVEKTHLLEQLIWMAKAYNKKALAEELMQYSLSYRSCSFKVAKMQTSCLDSNL